MVYRDMMQTKLEVRRGYAEAPHLQYNYAVSAAQEGDAPNKFIPGGRVMHVNDAGVLELGAEGRQMPFFLWKDSDSFAAGVAAPDVTSADAKRGTFSTGDERVLRVYAGIGHFDMETTEFDKTKTYLRNQPLIAPVLDDGDPDYDVAGVLTNAGAVRGKVLIVGIVTVPTSPVNQFVHDAYGFPTLRFITTYEPPIEGLPDGLDEPTWD